jgi:hypothetical protein
MLLTTPNDSLSKNAFAGIGKSHALDGMENFARRQAWSALWQADQWCLSADDLCHPPKKHSST